MTVHAKFDTYDGIAMGNAPNGMTKRERYELGGHGAKIPKSDVDAAFMYLLSWFWELRSYAGGYDVALTPDKIPLWLSDKYPSCDECATLLAMDRAYRVTMGEVMAENEKRRRDKK